MKNRIRVILITFSIFVFGCSEPASQISDSIFQIKSGSSIPLVSDSNIIETEIKLRRGAFHFDEFVVNYQTLNYKASEDKHYLENYPEYLEDDSLDIDKNEFRQLIEWILEKGFWKLDDKYEDISTCSSGISVTIKIGDKSKTVECEDFEGGCPELLFEIEQKLIVLNNNRLSRIILPG